MKGRFLILKDKNLKDEYIKDEYGFPLINNGSTPGINTPEISLPAYNPPVPNRAWTAMRNGKDIDELTEEEKRMLYYGKDGIL